MNKIISYFIRLFSCSKDIRQNKLIPTNSTDDLSSDNSDDLSVVIGRCNEVLEDLIKLNGEFIFRTNDTAALFIPLPIFEEFKMDILNQAISIEDIWDYDLKIADTIEPTKLVWIRGRTGQEFTIHPTVRRAFSFLQPHYLRYLDKPFNNPDVSTQVNLALDYYRKQKRQRGAEIFNIFDLIAVKMAIDDNRLQFENCEFHNLIDQMLTEVVANDGRFNLNKYLGDRFELREDLELIHYLIYNFQKTIGCINWRKDSTELKINLATIDNVTTFLEKCYTVRRDPYLHVSESDSTGKSANILFDILTKTKKQINFVFELSEWHYSKDGPLSEITEPLTDCLLAFGTSVSLRFAKEFTNWIKHIFGPRAREFITLEFLILETINPDIFIDLYVKDLTVFSCTLDCNLIQNLKKCKYGLLSITECKIADYNKQRFFDLSTLEIGCEQTIFKLFDELDNVEKISLEWEENTVATLNAYVESVMAERNLTEYQLKNQIMIGTDSFYKFNRNGIGAEVEAIQPFIKSGDLISNLSTQKSRAIKSVRSMIDDLSPDNSVVHSIKIIKDSIKLNNELEFRSDNVAALFVPLTTFEEFQMDIEDHGVSIENSWDYNLSTKHTIEPTKLVWIRGRKWHRYTMHPTVKRAFSFLQPNYLRYLDKPFTNPYVSTQVNLVLDYHRKQKRQRGVEIFNIFDLIAIKMAIDDIRLQFEYSEIHNLIDQKLTEVVAKDGIFYLNNYLSDRFEIREDLEFIHYLIYHFQKTIGCINWLGGSTVFNINLATIDNVTTFLEKCYTVHPVPFLFVLESDSSAKSANILFNILTKTKKQINFTFHLSEWHYSKGGPLNEITESLTDCWLAIATPASLCFAEEFTNWIKHIFGPRAREFITLIFQNLETFNPDNFIDLYVKDLKFLGCTLDCNLIQILKKCNYGLLSIVGCKIADFNKQTFFDLTAPQIGCEQNIFKFLDVLDNVKNISLVLEENTIGTLHAYVESVMAERKLTEYQLKNKIMIGSDEFSKFKRNGIGAEVEAIQPSIKSGDLNSNLSTLVARVRNSVRSKIDDLSPVNSVVHSIKIIKDSIKLNNELEFRSDNVAALFVPLTTLKEFQMDIEDHGISIENSWDYNLKIADTFEPTKLVWIRGRKWHRYTMHPTVKRAFSFLQPYYLRYLDKPFHNPDVSTQVNFVLDYHCKQNRERGAEIFNIFDLIAIKMAIGDIRLQFENCEFYNLIDQKLTEVVANDGTFYLNEYLTDRNELREDLEFIHYLIYNFQKTIECIKLCDVSARWFKINLATIDDVTTFLEKCYTVRRDLYLHVSESDSTGKSANILFDILTKTKKPINFTFELSEWHYSKDGPLTEITEPLTNCWLAIGTPASLRFAEEFTNWIKHIFGPRAREFIRLGFEDFKTINPDNFIYLYVKELEFLDCTLDYKVINILKKCNYGLLYITDCKITDKQTATAPQIGCEQNIFKFLDALDNVGEITLTLEDHTIATLNAYVASVMTEEELTEFQLKNKIKIGSDTFSKFKCIGTNIIIDSDSDKSDEIYDLEAPCVEVVTNIIETYGGFEFRTNYQAALLVPLPILEIFKMDIQYRGISIVDIWDYDLIIGHTIEPTKLVWVQGRTGQKCTSHPRVKRAFTFLQPHYLRYLDKPFHNSDVSTQANLILDYHRKQKRQRGVEIFNIFDLIGFKMGIDDNRLQYENCEFHKLIDKMLTEVVAKDDEEFDLNKYLEDRIEFRKDLEFIHYLIYHFQETIGYITWRRSNETIFNINLAAIDNVTTFLEKVYKIGDCPTFYVSEPDSSGKSANILFDILTKTKKQIDFQFELSKWPYSKDGPLNKITKPLTDCLLVFGRRTSFRFVKEFTNWIKVMFGSRARDSISLIFHNLEAFDEEQEFTRFPDIFIDFSIKVLVFSAFSLDYHLIEILKKCNYAYIKIANCKIVDYSMQRFDLITPNQMGCEKNIFKFFDELDNVLKINLQLEAHTIATLFTYVASVMTERKLTEFQLKHKIKMGPVEFFKFQRNGMGMEVEEIIPYSSSGDRIDIYQDFNQLPLIDREEFDFYQ